MRFTRWNVNEEHGQMGMGGWKDRPGRTGADRRTEHISGILEAREERYHEKCRLRERLKLPVLSVMLNIPGENKSGPLYRNALDSMIKSIDALLGNAVIFHLAQDSADGAYALFAVKMGGAALKTMMMDLEERHPFGRFFDLDVMGADGELFSRTSMGFPPRTCYLCGRPAKECSSLQRHALPELRELIDRELERYLEGNWR